MLHERVKKINKNTSFHIKLLFVSIPELSDGEVRRMEKYLWHLALGCTSHTKSLCFCDSTFFLSQIFKSFNIFLDQWPCRNFPTYIQQLGRLHNVEVFHISYLCVICLFYGHGRLQFSNLKECVLLISFQMLLTQWMIQKEYAQIQVMGVIACQTTKSSAAWALRVISVA